MNEFSEIFALDLTTTVFFVVSVSFLVALAAAAILITRGRQRGRSKQR